MPKRRKHPLIEGESPRSRRNRLRRISRNRLNEVSRLERGSPANVGGSPVSTPVDSPGEVRRRQRRHYSRRVQGLDSCTPPTPVVADRLLSPVREEEKNSSPVLHDTSESCSIIHRVRRLRNLPESSLEPGVLPVQRFHKIYNSSQRNNPVTINDCLEKNSKGFFCSVQYLKLQLQIFFILSVGTIPYK